MARVAADDDSYRRQLEELAEARDGIYSDALVLLGGRDLCSPVEQSR
jgi:hypothetical protein